MKIGQSKYPDDSSLKRLRVFITKTLRRGRSRPGANTLQPQSADAKTVHKTKADKRA